jgi:hypothetical protein
MNEQQLVKSERIASRIMRILAIIGLVSTLALIAWVLVQGFKLIPDTGTQVRGALSSVSALFSTSKQESIAIQLTSTTLTSGEPMDTTFVYTGSNTPENYNFSYSCVSGITLTVRTNAGDRNLACATTLSFNDPNVTLVFTSSLVRFADIELSVTSGARKGTTLVTVVNTAISSSSVGATNEVRATTTSSTSSPASVASITKPTTATAPRTVPPTAPARTPADQPTDLPVGAVVPVATVTTTPADLVLAITDTGILVQVSGQDTFFPVSPIPNDKTAAVVFTVTNTGSVPSSPWAFKAWLPMEGDTAYQYTSPLQQALAPGMEVTYTLGFDEVTNTKSGVITLELASADQNDKISNNTDTVDIKIK